MSTPHISARQGDFAPTVLMPGDPLRSKFIAENYLDSPLLVNDVRGVQGYTGYYKGVRLSVMASGMGIPSIGIYSHELFSFYGVENIIRIGSAGAISDSLKLFDIVAGITACTDSHYADHFGIPFPFAPAADYGLLRAADRAAAANGSRLSVGALYSTDAFYGVGDELHRRLASMGVLAVEMEAAGLYLNAAAAGKRALAICTVSDHILRGEHLSPDQRQTAFGEMMTIALETAVGLDGGQ